MAIQGIRPADNPALVIAVFVWLWLMTGTDLLWKNSTADWLVVGGWCWFSIREQYCWLVGWQAERTRRMWSWAGGSTSHALETRLQLAMHLCRSLQYYFWCVLSWHTHELYSVCVNERFQQTLCFLRRTIFVTICILYIWIVWPG